MLSDCCGAPPHQYFDDICGDCGEHCEFYDIEDQEGVKKESKSINNNMKTAKPTDYSKLIISLSEKNYADADKYLQSIIQDKIKQKIAKCAKQL